MLRKLAAAAVISAAVVAMPTAAVYMNYRTFADDSCSNCKAHHEADAPSLGSLRSLLIAIIRARSHS